MTRLEIPPFISKALSILPRFLEAVDDRGVRRLSGITFYPDLISDPCEEPSQAYASFEMSGCLIVFYSKYRPGEEGTSGSLEIDYIDYCLFGSATLTRRFRYVEHHCWCASCRGSNYPFVPKGTLEEHFNKMSEVERLMAIRNYVQTVFV